MVETLKRMADRSALSGVWQPLVPDDLPRVFTIEAELHPSLPERREVTAEKLRLFPVGCRKLVRGGVMVGYALAHPWRLFHIPALDTFLDAIPADADCLHMHDVAILPEGRGENAAERYVLHLADLARAGHLPAIACVSVYGTSRLWARMGFDTIVSDGVVGSIGGYGPTARYMVLRLPALPAA